MKPEDWTRKQLLFLYRLSSQASVHSRWFTARQPQLPSHPEMAGDSVRWPQNAPVGLRRAMRSCARARSWVRCRACSSSGVVVGALAACSVCSMA
jgi:hypothetical protein